ncbi:hypothetical protein D3C87_784460 [compost metagenome]
MKRVLFATALAGAVLSTGCATLIGGSPSEVSVNVQEPRKDLEVRLQGIQSGETIIQRVPEFTVPLNRSSDYKVTVRSPFYQTQEIRIGRNIRPIFWLNFLTVVPLGMIVDAVTHNMWEHSPNRVTVRLEPARQGSNGDWVVPIIVSRGLSREVYEAPIIDN